MAEMVPRGGECMIPDSVILMSTPIIEWEITKVEWKARYALYAKIAVPLVAAITLSAMFGFWFVGILKWAGSVWILFGLAVAFSLYRDYQNHPKKFQFFDDYLTITVRDKERSYPWGTFMGYIDGATLSRANISQTRNASAYSVEQIHSTVEQGSRIFGTWYYLIRPWGWYNPYPYSRAIMIATEPHVSASAGAIIQQKLSPFSPQRIQRRLNIVATLFGVIIFLGFFYYSVYF